MMTTKRRAISVSWHQASGQFVKWIGKAKGRDGQVKPKVHYLGPDEAAALAKASALKAEWTALRQSGIKEWPCRDWHVYWGKLPRSTAHTQASDKIGLTLDRAVQEYRDWLAARCDAQQVTPQFRESVRYMLVHVVSQLGVQTPLANIGEAQLSSLTLAFASRLVGHRDGSVPISIVYAQKLAKTAKAFFVWLYETGRWNGRPRNFDRLFRFKSVLTVAEQIAKLQEGRVEPRFFTVEELTKLYSVACDRHRLWILLSLNCGFAQAELDSLHHFEIKELDSAAPYIERFRQKTQVYARWSLWPETADLLRKYRAGPNADDLALFTERGKRLKSVAPSGVFSGVSEAFRGIVKRSGIDKGSYKLLRKTGARMTKQIGGLEVSAMYLAHQEPGFNKAYAGRRWDRLDAALEELRRQLAPMFRAGNPCGVARFSGITYCESNGLLPFLI